VLSNSNAYILINAGGLFSLSVVFNFPSEVFGDLCSDFAIPIADPLPIKKLTAGIQFTISSFSGTNFSQIFRFQLFYTQISPVPLGGTISTKTEAPAQYIPVKNGYIDVKINYPHVTSGPVVVSAVQSREVLGFPTLPENSMVVWLVKLAPGQPGVPSSTFTSIGFWARMD
jgi:hypothetical protein